MLTHKTVISKENFLLMVDVLQQPAEGRLVKDGHKPRLGALQAGAPEHFCVPLVRK